MALPAPQVIQGELYVPDPRTGQLIPEWQAKLLGIPVLGTMARELIGPEQLGTPITGAAPMGLGRSAARWARPGAGTPLQQLQRAPAVRPTARVPFEQSVAKAAKESQYPLRSAAQRRALGLPDPSAGTPLQRGAEYMTSGAPRVPAGMGGQNIEMLKSPLGSRAAGVTGAAGFLGGVGKMAQSKAERDAARKQAEFDASYAQFSGQSVEPPQQPLMTEDPYGSPLGRMSYRAGPPAQTPAQSVMGLGPEGTTAGVPPALAAQPQEPATAQEPYVVKKNDTLTDIATAHLSQGGKKPTKKEVWRQAAVWADSLNLEGKGKKLKTRGTDLKPGMKLPEVSADLETRPGVYVDLFGAPKKPPKKAVSDAGQVARMALDAAGPIGKTYKGPYGTEGFMPDPLPDTSKVVSAPLRELDVLPSRDIAPPKQVAAAPSPGRSARRELVPPGQDYSAFNEGLQRISERLPSLVEEAMDSGDPSAFMARGHGLNPVATATAGATGRDWRTREGPASLESLGYSHLPTPQPEAVPRYQFGGSVMDRHPRVRGKFNYPPNLYTSIYGP